MRADRRDRDEYDERAVHVLVKLVKFDRYAGCARVVHVDPGNPLSRLPSRGSRTTSRGSA